MMPMAAHVDSIVGDHDEMKGAWENRAFTSGTQVFLACLVGLDGADGYVENSAHATRASAVPTARITMAMSRTELS